mmetsp:Transcript_874/g.1811  ORF Transcript_874/g.1811 Transcript_874/m.1811 type:complete len:137 (+) Transcript_874:3531-3941(+)
MSYIIASLIHSPHSILPLSQLLRYVVLFFMTPQFYFPSTHHLIQKMHFYLFISQPTISPIPESTPQPTEQPTPQPSTAQPTTEAPTPEPTPLPTTPEPTNKQTPEPTEQTPIPTPQPTPKPSPELTYVVEIAKPSP